MLKHIKKLLVVELQDIPYTTLLAVRTFQNYTANSLMPSWKEHYSDEQVDDLLARLPRSLRDALLPFQIEGVRFGLRRGARCLIADEMGLGKTIQVKSFEILFYLYIKGTFVLQLFCICLCAIRILYMLV